MYEFIVFFLILKDIFQSFPIRPLVHTLNTHVRDDVTESIVRRQCQVVPVAQRIDAQ